MAERSTAGDRGELARRGTAALVALALAGCATNPDGTTKLDDRATGALLGALAGCAIASASGSECAKGAAIGAAAGFLIGWYYQSKKVADARQINKEYAAKKYAVPKKEITPAAYQTEVKLAPPEPTGEREVQVTSNTDLVGFGDKVPQVQEKYAIYDENNNVVDTRTEKVAAVDGAGRYRTESKFKLPPNAKGKKYRVETTLVADNKAVKKNSYEVSFGGDGRLMVAAL